MLLFPLPKRYSPPGIWVDNFDKLCIQLWPPKYRRPVRLLRDVTKVVHEVSETVSNHNLMNYCKKKMVKENFLEIHLKKERNEVGFYLELYF